MTSHDFVNYTLGGPSHCRHCYQRIDEIDPDGPCLSQPINSPDMEPHMAADPTRPPIQEWTTADFPPSPEPLGPPAPSVADLVGALAGRLRSICAYEEAMEIERIAGRIVLAERERIAAKAEAEAVRFAQTNVGPAFALREFARMLRGRS